MQTNCSFFFILMLVQGKLGKWSFKSKTHDTLYDGYMFPLLVQDQLEFWPEQNVRQRTWVSNNLFKRDEQIEGVFESVTNAKLIWAYILT